MSSVSAYYEPFSTLLGELTQDAVATFKPSVVSGHPALDAPYYDEYRPLIDAGGCGVSGYHKSFGTDRFGASPDAGFPALRAYLQGLADHAQHTGRAPAYKFCRSQGRMPWLRSAFPDDLHVWVWRNPASQFASGWMLKQQWQNAFFVAAPFRVLGLNRDEPVVQKVIEMCGVTLPPGAPTSVESYAALCDQYARTVEGLQAYRAFLALWVLCASRLTDDIELTVDMDRVGRIPEYAGELREQFRVHAEVSPDFSGARNLVGEAAHLADRVKGIDGGALRPVHSSAQKFIQSQATDSQKQLVETVREKLILASEISASWR